MKAKIDGQEIKSDKPYVLVSPSWGLVGEYYQQHDAVQAMLAGVKCPVPRYGIADGQLVKSATLYLWNESKKTWKPMKSMTVKES